MKAHINKLSPSETHKQVQQTEIFYKQWLLFSDMSEEDMLKEFLKGSFSIKVEQKEKKFPLVIAVGYIENSMFHKVGQSFVSPSVKKNNEFILDLSFMLVYISNKIGSEQSYSCAKKYAEELLYTYL